MYVLYTLALNGLTLKLSRHNW